MLWKSDAEKFVWRQVSRNVKELTGRSAEYWVKGGRSWLNAVHAEGREQVERSVRSAVRRKKDFELNFRVAGAKKSAGWVHSDVRVVRDGRGQASSLEGRTVRLGRQAGLEQEVRMLRKKLAAGEQRWQDQFKNSPIPVSCWRKKGRDFVFTQVSDSWMEMTEGKAAEHLGIAAKKAYASHPEIPENMRRCCEEKRIIRDESEYVLFSLGKVIDALVAYVPISADTVLVYVFDLTEYKKAQEEVSKLSSAVEQTEDSILITNREWVIEYVNPAFEKLTGYTLAEVVGKKPNILKSGMMDPAVYDDLSRTLMQGNAYRGEFLNRKKSGQLFYEDKSIFSLKDARGEITHFVSSGRDRTEQREMVEHERQLQAALENAAREWKLTVDSVEMAILIIDEQGIVHRLNRTAQEMLERSFDEIVGNPLAGFASAEPWPTVIGAIEEVRHARHPVSLQVYSPEKEETWHLTVNQFLDPYWERTNVMVTLRDITATVELEETVFRNETMAAMGRLVAGVAHEVRNPLFSISATLDAIEARYESSAEYSESMEILRLEINRLSKLMQELLEYGKPARLQLAENNMAAIIQEAIAACRVLAQTSNVEIVSRIDVDLPPVSVDSRRMSEVFRNILDNAIQHSGGGGKVEIEARVFEDGQGNWVECSVRDSGPGFAPDDIPRLFEPFFTKRQGGTGLGLALAQRAIEQHGGRIIARNAPEGGAEMLIRLRYC